MCDGSDAGLAGVAAGVVDVPVIGLPGCAGSGVGGAGEASLNTMVHSCSSGLVVVNIDDGVGAGADAVLIAQRRLRGRSQAPTAKTIEPSISKPKKIGNAARDKSGPATRPNDRAATMTTKPTHVASHGKPRRRRPAKSSHSALGRFFGSRTAEW